MNISNISREQFIHTITVPWAEPLPVLGSRAPSHNMTAWEGAGQGVRFAGEAAITAALRLATPAITGFGLGKNWVDKHPNLALGAPLAAAGGAVVGTVVGATGIVIDAGIAAFGLAVAAGFVTQAGIDAWRPEEPKRG